MIRLPRSICPCRIRFCPAARAAISCHASKAVRPGDPGISTSVSRMVGEPAYSARQTRRAPDVPLQPRISPGTKLTQPALPERVHAPAVRGGSMPGVARSHRSEPAVRSPARIAICRIRFRISPVYCLEPASAYRLTRNTFASGLRQPGGLLDCRPMQNSRNERIRSMRPRCVVERHFQELTKQSNSGVPSLRRRV